MKATGVVRRIDDLGRIVVPKEIRRSLRIREGDSLEIYADGVDSIVLKKYSTVASINNFAIYYAQAIYASAKKDIIITDNERIIAAAGNFKKDLIGRKIDARLDDKIQKRTMLVFNKNDGLEITENLIINNGAVLKPIVIYGDIVGSVIIIADTITDLEKILVDSAATFLSKYLES